jgi:N-acetyl-alpha-D-glucosaminyl L-malate synthase BshA
VMTLHGTDVSTFGHDPQTGRAIGTALREIDAVTTVSESHARLSAHVFGLPTPPRVIPNFVDLWRFRPRAAFPLPVRTPRNRRLRIVHVSNLREVKDPESLARIFVLVRRELDAELWLVGDGDGMSSVRSILRAGGAERHVRFFGLRREIHHILPRTDILLLTSRMESFCLTALEAAACGLPVVAPRVGGLPEIVADGLTGLLYEPGNEEEATRSVLRVLTEADIDAGMRAGAVQRARLFSSEAIVGRYERLYRELLQAIVPAGDRERANDRLTLAARA